MLPQHLRYTATHEWCKPDGDLLVIGVTEHALASLGRLIYIDLPEVGDDVLVEVPFGEIEGMDDARDVRSPFDGRVAEVNHRLSQNPDLLTKDPYEEGWLIRLKPDAPLTLDNLLSASDYDDLLKKRKK